MKCTQLHFLEVSLAFEGQPFSRCVQLDFPPATQIQNRQVSATSPNQKAVINPRTGVTNQLG